MKKRMGRWIGFVLAAPLLWAGGTAHAQVVADACPPSERVVGDIGISGIECTNCSFTISEDGRKREWRFRSEPVIRSVRPGAPARGALEPGDVITAIDGKLITSREGGRRLASIKPADTVVLTVRRDGRTRQVSLIATARCQRFNPPTEVSVGEPRVPEAPEPADIAGVAEVPDVPEVAEVPEAPEAPPVPGGVVVGPRPGVPMGELFPRGWFGFGIQCDCSVRTPSPFEPPVWSFNEPPEVFSVEDGSPADRAGLRRGDELLEIDGVSLTSQEGGRAFGAIKAGETVRFTYRRGSARRTVALRAERRPNVVEVQGRSQAAEALVERLTEIRAQQEALTAQLRERQRLQQELAQEQLRELIGQMEAQTAEQRAAQRDIERLLLEAITARRESPPLPDNRVRFTGTLGDFEIVVRGGSNVIATVVEEDEELIILTGDARIHVKRIEQ